MSIWMNIKIGQKLGFVFGAIILVLLSSGVLITLMVNQSTRAVEAMQQIQRVVTNVNAMHKQATDMLVDVRGFLLTADRAYVEDYEQGSGEFDAMADTIRSALVDHPTAQAALAEYRAVVDAWAAVAARQIGLMRNPLTANEARIVEVNGAGGDFMVALQLKFSALDEVQSKILADYAVVQQVASQRLQYVVVASIIIGVAIALLAYRLLMQGIRRPIMDMTDVMSVMAGGQHAVTVPGIGRGDEVGAMAAAVEVFRKGLAENERLQAEAESKRKHDAEQSERLRGLTKAFEARARGATEDVASVAKELERTAQALTSLANQSAGRTANVSEAMNRTSQSVQTVATASTELSVSIAEISKQMAGANEMTRKVRLSAEATQGEVRSLSEEVQSIGDVVTLIQEIANQTNLLALNATIESARAGEAGKGFAVVANEVKALASQTARATDQIGGQIMAVQERTRMTVGSIEAIVDQVRNLENVASSVAAAVEEQDAATKEISRNVEEVSMAAESVSENIGEVRNAASETGNSSMSLLETARGLSTQANNLQRDVGQFLEDVRVG